MDRGLQSESHSHQQSKPSGKRFKFVYKNERKNSEVDETFNASVGSFGRFKTRGHLSNVKITGEAVSAIEDAASKYPVVRKHNLRWWMVVFNVDETDICIKI